MQLIRSAIAEGIWQGTIATDAPDPDIQIWHQAAPLGGVVLAPQTGVPGQVDIRFPIPSELLNDGVQTFVVKCDGTQIGSFSILTGTALDQDLRAEIDLLRAELDMLKKAFRRHCAES